MLIRTVNCPAASIGIGATQSKMAGHVVIVEDDCEMSRRLVGYFAEQHLDALSISSCSELKQHLEGAEPSLILLSLQPGQDGRGLDVLMDIRTISEVPIIVLGQHRNQFDRAEGLERGADDYLVKPFNLRELVARVRALLRRQQKEAVRKKSELKSGKLKFGEWQLGCHDRLLTGRTGQQVKLSKAEYAILRAFLDAPREVLTREDLLQATRVHQDVLDRSIDILVMRLRRKLNVEKGAPPAIVTYRGVGYAFSLAVEPL